jgi:signal transduction histidine kinase
MARQLRQFRQSSAARLLRAQVANQAAIDSFPHPVLILDPTGGLELANPSARRLLGLAPPPAPKGGAEVPPSPWQPPEVLRGPLREALRDQKPFLPEGFDQAVCWAWDGREHYFLPRVLPIRDPGGDTLGAAVLLEDVTRFRLLDQVKSNLVATVSHELKTPLASLQLALHLLLSEKVGALYPKQLELLLDARDNAERLLTMVNQLLDLARLEQGGRQLDLQRRRPADLLQDAADAARPRAADKEIDLRVRAPDDLPEVAVDGPRLGHALQNLLNNAVTYTDRGGTVTLAAEAADCAVVLTVADTGRGIPAEYLPRVFDKFFRVPGQERGSGTGLGLAIVHEVVTAHGGTITCQSEDGRGTTFRITLPAAEARP